MVNLLHGWIYFDEYKSDMYMGCHVSANVGRKSKKNMLKNRFLPLFWTPRCTSGAALGKVIFGDLEKGFFMFITLGGK